MYLSIQQVSYHHSDKELLFNNISFSIDRKQKVALIGNNGSGKSTLLRIISGEIEPAAGEIQSIASPYYIPQHFGQYIHSTIAEALNIDKKRKALNAIVAGNVEEENFTILNDEWDIEERAISALSFWGMDKFSLDHPFALLSGGEKTKVLLSGLNLHMPEIILLDEPTNHLDYQSREKLYEYIQMSSACFVIVSHDRKLLNQLSHTFELTPKGITAYGGNYDFYKAEKDKITNAMQSQLEEKEKQLRAAKKTAREIAERRQKQEVRGEKRSAKQGVARIVMGMLKDKSEKSTSQLKDIHEEKQQKLSQSMTEIRQALPSISQMKVDFNNSSLHKGKILVQGKSINHSFGTNKIWSGPLDIQITSGERIAIEGENGSGKTTLLQIITGKLIPSEGTITHSDPKIVYIDQEYSLINERLTILEQAWEYNERKLPDHEIKTLLNRYLFPKNSWDKTCNSLSGGEKMRLALCCLMISDNTPDIFILDEPTNNIDIQNIEILTATIKDYQGTILLVSHDTYFKEEIGIERKIILERNYNVNQ